MCVECYADGDQRYSICHCAWVGKGLYNRLTWVYVVQHYM